MEDSWASSSNSEERFGLCKEMQLLEFPDKFVIKSTDSQPFQPFSIGRADGMFRQLDDWPTGDPMKVHAIFGVVGTIRLLAGTYVLVITSRKQVGTYFGSHIFQVMSMKFFACNETLKLSSFQEKRDEAYFMTLLKTVEFTPGLYYSYEVDLTLNLQRKYKLAARSRLKPLWKQLDAFIIPLVQGMITTIARRCTRRLGTRMWRRGANLDGDTANFVETEQIVEFDGLVSSYMQIRGSIPLLWEQIVDLSYKPRLNIISHVETSKVVERHFIDLALRYGSILVIDLTDKDGDEGKLSAVFATEMKNLSNVRYISFDFHHNCQKESFDNLQLLYDQAIEDIEDQGYFLATREEIIASRKALLGQIALIVLIDQMLLRLFNCIDRLVKDNEKRYRICDELVQNRDPIGPLGYSMTIKKRQSMIPSIGLALSFLQLSSKRRLSNWSCSRQVVAELSVAHANCFIAEKILNLQLQRMGAFFPADRLSKHPDMLEQFKTSWVEHGDDISLQYSGSHALKRDVVRYGRQTLPGLISDGLSALSRYYLNNFHDGVRQDAMDLVSGHYTVSQSNPSPFQLNGFESLSYLPVASALIVGGVTLTTFTLNQAGRNAQHFLSSVLWAGLTAGVLALVKANGRQFCSRPRLCGLL